MATSAPRSTTRIAIAGLVATGFTGWLERVSMATPFAKSESDTRYLRRRVIRDADAFLPRRAPVTAPWTVGAVVEQSLVIGRYDSWWLKPRDLRQVACFTTSATAEAAACCLVDIGELARLPWVLGGSCVMTMSSQASAEAAAEGMASDRVGAAERFIVFKAACRPEYDWSFTFEQLTAASWTAPWRGKVFATKRDVRGTA